MTGADLVTVVSGARGVWNVSINVVLMNWENSDVSEAKRAIT